MSPVLILLILAGKGLAVAGAVLQWPWAVVGLLFFAPDLTVAWHVFVPGAQGMGRVVTRFATQGKEVWLTIDDGPDEQDTPRILDLLEKHGARATFFLIGGHAARLPGLVAEIVARGHEVGHHTHTHPTRMFWSAPPGWVARELDDGLRALRSAGVTPRYFRAPVGIKGPFLDRALRRRGLIHVGWTIRSWDSTARDPEVVARTIARRVGPGSIVLLHEGPRLDPAIRVQAIARVLETLTTGGYACVVPPSDALR